MENTFGLHQKYLFHFHRIIFKKSRQQLGAEGFLLSATMIGAGLTFVVVYFLAKS